MYLFVIEFSKKRSNISEKYFVTVKQLTKIKKEKAI
jgi:hypothetical protein